MKKLEDLINAKKVSPHLNKDLISVSGLDFIQKLLNEDPLKRMTIKDAMNHHWFINLT